MITVFSLIANALQNSGFITAITNLKEPTDNDYNSVFWFNITVGSFLYVVLFVSAPWIADYYHTPALDTALPLCLPLGVGIESLHSPVGLPLQEYDGEAEGAG